MKSELLKMWKYLLLQIFIAAILPTCLLSDGAVQPEYSNFEPVSTSKMVNEFDGSFTYNLPLIEIPGPDGSGYALSLSYHSGVNQDDPASWVGWGWTLNPGSIVRNLRGLPDDYKNTDVTYFNKQEPNISMSAGISSKFEIFSVDFLSDTMKASIGGSFTLRYNNRNGFTRVYGLGLDMLSVASVDATFNEATGNFGFSYSLSPARLLLPFVNEALLFNQYSDDKNLKYLQQSMNGLEKTFARSVANSLNSYANYSYFSSGKTSCSFGYDGSTYNYAIAFHGPLFFFPIGTEFGVNGSYTNIKMTERVPLKAYGYMYSGSAAASDAIMDYSVEKDQGFQERDNFLGIPFNGADNFTVTGEGVTGGFRAYTNKAGHFRPNENTSTVGIHQGGLSFHFGTNFGMGLNLGEGYQQLNIRDWQNSNKAGFEFDSLNNNSSTEPIFFRFNNDLGGDVSFTKSKLSSESAQNAKINGSFFKDFAFDLSSVNNTNAVNSGKRSGRSSFIAYRTNKEIYADTVSRPGYVAYLGEYSCDPSRYVNRNDSKIADQIGEFIITNTEGMTYVYGLPVYSRNEKSLQYRINTSNPVDSNYFVHQYCDTTTSQGVTGHIFNTPYATTFLITAILSPDYSDVTLNGITDDDLGGFTKFTYRRTAGTYSKTDTTTSKWYRWRTPYDGFNFTPGSLSDSRDDIGSYSSGEKEIYYLNTIETKTHFALFVTNKTDTIIVGYGRIKGSDSLRMDAYEAEKDPLAGAQHIVNDISGISTSKVERLEKIMLFAKHSDSTATLLKTVKLNYDYSLCKNSPGSIQQGGVVGGKLTLKNLWIENENTHENNVSPYIFGYNYGAFNYPAAYHSLDNYGGGSLVENPDYNVYNTDRWGNYQYKGSLRYNSLINSVNQVPDSKFDPAAWNLKTISLPSQGNIHVQYEQNDYSNVQDRPAFNLVSLKSHNWTTNKFTLNLQNDLGITTSTQRNALLKVLKQRFMGMDPELIYFKFLFSLVGSSPQLYNRNDRRSDYITGYLKVTSIDIVGSDIVIGLGGNKDPRTICKEFVGANRSGILDDGFNPSSDAGNIIALLGYVGRSFSCDCDHLNDSFSFLRIPSIKPKKGGGIRVKRLLTLDVFDKRAEVLSGVENRLYGKEYIYLNPDSSSSGVATYEPGLGREENSLIYNFKKRRDQTFIEKATYGKDLDEFEGPIGESVMPGPSVGYSRVLVKDIFSGYTDNGFQIYNFFTSKDYPLDHYYPKLNVKGVSWTSLNKKDYTRSIPLGFYSYRETSMSASQGYQFILYNINGKPKSVETYGGNVADTTTWRLSTATNYEYFEPGEDIPAYSQFAKHDSAGYLPGSDPLGRDFKYPTKTLGSEMDLTIESKQVDDYTNSKTIDFDASLGLATFIPIPFASVWGGVDESESILKTHVITKVIRYAPILKRVTNYADGLYSVTENVNFDPNTGQPVLTRYTDGYDKASLFHPSKGTTFAHKGAYYSYSFPAAEQYPAMGQKASNDRYNFKSDLNGIYCNAVKTMPDGKYYLNFIQASTYYNDDWPTPNFSVGDLLKIKDTLGNFIAYYHVKEVNLHSLLIDPYLSLPSTPLDPWTISKHSVNIEVVKSGRTNQLSAQCGNMVTYGNGSGIKISGLEMPYKFGQFDMTTFTNGPLYSPYFTSTMLGTVNARQNIANALDYAVKNGLAHLAPGAYSVNIKNLRGNSSCTTFSPDSLTINYYGSPVATEYSISYTQDGTGGFNLINYHSKKFPIANTSIKLDKHDASIGVVYGSNDSLVKINLFDFCIGLMPEFMTINAIKATATMYDSANTKIAPSNPTVDGFVNNQYGKWKPSRDYIYYSVATNDSVPFTSRVYDNSGTASEFELLNWNYPSVYDSWTGVPWQKVNTNQIFNQNGDLVEKKNSLGIISGTTFDNKNILPAITYTDAPFQSAGFESCEKLTGGGVSTKYAHTGKKSFYLGTASQILLLNNIKKCSNHNSGVLVSFWLKTTYIKNSNDLSDSLFAYAQFVAVPLWNTRKIKLAKIAQTGEWSLYEGVIDSIAYSGHVDGDYFSVGLKNTQNLTGYQDSIFVDDFRVQPINAACTSYVYDYDHLRLSAILDDQHFAKVFQYTPEGKLNRMIMETEKGFKTISEAYYNTPKVDRTSGMTVYYQVQPSSGSSFPLGSQSKPFDSKTYLNDINNPRKSGDGKPGEFDGKFNLIDIQVDENKRQIKLFDNDIDTLSNGIKGLKQDIDNQDIDNIDVPGNSNFDLNNGQDINIRSLQDSLKFDTDPKKYENNIIDSLNITPKLIDSDHDIIQETVKPVPADSVIKRPIINKILKKVTNRNMELKK